MVGIQAQLVLIAASEALKTALFAFWPPRKGSGLSRSEPARADFVAGQPYPPAMRRLTLSGLVLSQTANFSAACAFDVPLSTATEEPPQLADANLPAVPHCGIGATFHFPDVSGALPEIIAPPHCADGQATMLPFWRSLYHPFAKSGTVAINPASRSLSQYAATFTVSGEAIFTDHVSPLRPNHLAPACQASEVNHAELPGGKVLMYCDGFAS